MSEHTRYLDSIEHVKQSFDYVPGRTRFLAITVKVVDDVR